MDWDRQFRAWETSVERRYQKQASPGGWLRFQSWWRVRPMRRSGEGGIVFAIHNTEAKPVNEDQRTIEELANEAYIALLNNDAAGQRWIMASFAGTTERDDVKRRFIYCLLQEADQMPEWLFGPMMRAAVYEPDPSFNGHYIKPCLRCFGPHRVNDELFRYLETGTNVEKAEGLKAFYHSMHREPIEAFYHLTGGEIDPPEYFFHLRQRLCDWFLTEFIANPDIDVRRRIIMNLYLKPENYSLELRPLLPEVIRLAREHPDEYIRNRIEHHLGNDVPHMVAPPTSNPYTREVRRRI